MLSRLLLYFQLCRLPNVFTAMADVFMGFLVMHGGFRPVGAFLLLLLSSSCLYTAGMVLNDLFDVEKDRRERPGRPLPSGRVPLRAAVGLAVVLTALGIAAGWAANATSGLVAGALAVCVLLYDGVLKRTFAAPVLMGACRFLNVMLAMSVAAAAVGPAHDGQRRIPAPSGENDGPTGISAPPQDVEAVSAPLLDHLLEPFPLHVASALGVYIVGVTWFARREAGTSGRGQLAAAAGVINLAFVIYLGLGVNVENELPGRGPFYVLPYVFFFGVIALVLNRRLLLAILTRGPQQVQMAVVSLVLSIIMLDAAVVVLVLGFWPALPVVALLLPALVLGRWVYST